MGHGNLFHLSIKHKLLLNSLQETQDRSQGEGKSEELRDTDGFSLKILLNSEAVGVGG